MTIGELKKGDIYGNGKYLVKDKNDQSIGIMRLEDKWHIRIESTSINWLHIVKVTQK